jgi:RNA polymerase sigma-70 factor (sigma-E family)
VGGVAVAASQVAFQEFVASSSPALLRAAWLLTGEEALAQDLVQAAFERTWTRWERVTGTDEPLAYVRKVMTSIFLTWRRRRWWAEIPSSSPWQVAPVIDDAEGALVRRCLLAALAQLSSRQRAVVVLRYFADLSEAQTAASLGCSLGTVKAHAARALNNLRSAPELDGLWRAEVPDEQR